MKMIMIAYNEAVDMEVMEILAGCGLTNYTKIAGIFGSGTASGTHLGTDVWPGLNNMLCVACPDDRAARLLSGIRSLRATLGKEGVKAFQWSLDEIT